MKKLMITDVTRMDHGNCCIAGICHEEGNRLYRLCSPYITQDEARSIPIAVGSVFSGDFTRQNVVSGPHREDCNWNLSYYHGIGTAGELENYFYHSSVVSLEEGLNISEKGTDVTGYAGRGRSIVTIRPETASLHLMSPFAPGERQKLKMHFSLAGIFMQYLPVNDFRFYDVNGAVDTDVVKRAKRCLALWQNGECDFYLRVGLTRPWQGKYWLQVDGLHFFKCATGEYYHQFSSSHSGFQNVA